MGRAFTYKDSRTDRKEMIEINKLLPGKDVEEQLLREFNFVFDDKAEEASSYISFYKYYPSFQSINF